MLHGPSVTIRHYVVSPSFLSDLASTITCCVTVQRVGTLSMLVGISYMCGRRWTERTVFKPAGEMLS